MKVTLTLELELLADPGTEEAVDTWAWALERTVEELNLVTKAEVVDLTFEKE